MRSTPLTGHAALFNGPRKAFRIKTYPLGKPGPKEVILRMKRSGICGTDIHIAEGRLPMPISPLIPGHEFIGELMTAGSRVKRDGLGQPLHTGDMAIASVALPCGACFNCKNDETASCLNFGVTYLKSPETFPHFHGGYAEYLFSPASNLVKIPRDLNLDAVAAFACAGPTVIRAFDFAGNMRRGELVVIQGTGPVGLFATAWAAQAGCRVVVIGSGSNPKRLRLARRLGAMLTMDYRRVPEAERLKRICKLASGFKRGNGADVVFEASGSPKAIPEGLNLVRTRGRYVIPGQYSSSGGIEIQPQLITFKAITLIGSGQYKLTDINTYLRFLSARPALQKRLAECITHRYRLKDVNLAMANASKGQSIKAVFVS